MTIMTEEYKSHVRDGIIASVKAGQAVEENIDDLMDQLMLFEKHIEPNKHEYRGFLVGYCAGEKIVAKTRDEFWNLRKKIDPTNKRMSFKEDLRIY